MNFLFISIFFRQFAVSFFGLCSTFMNSILSFFTTIPQFDIPQKYKPNLSKEMNTNASCTCHHSSLSFSVWIRIITNVRNAVMHTFSVSDVTPGRHLLIVRTHQHDIQCESIDAVFVYKHLLSLSFAPSCIEF